MEDGPLVGVVDRPGNLGHQGGRLAGVPPEPDQVPDEIPPLDQLHAEVRLVVDLADLVDRDDVGVVELRDGLGLDPEPADLGVGGQ